MASLLEIKKQIGGVKNTKKITRAMQLVATSKMKQFQKKALFSRGYTLELLHMLSQSLGAETRNMYTEKRTQGSRLFVVYTSDKGLCGGLNTSLLKTLLRSQAWKETPENERILITIGKKANEFAISNKFVQHKHFIGISESLPTETMLHIIQSIVDVWTHKQCKDMLFVVPHFHNTFTFYPTIKTFLPFSVDMIQAQTQHLEPFHTKEDDSILLEPSNEEVQDALFLRIIEGVFIQSFFELKASEYSSRMIAMQNATEAANKKITELSRTYNKTRQQVITQQLAELIAASEAL